MGCPKGIEGKKGDRMQEDCVWSFYHVTGGELGR